MDYGKSETSKNWTEKSSAVSPTIFGVAAGIILGDMMHRGARRPVAASLICLGAAALAPAVAEAVRDKVVGPRTRRGSQRTLSSIRDAAIPSEDVDVYREDIGI
ncbi:hypothetical protein [Rubritalea marina]|uniref:hypothetical protein n=1 Tax=Rubritalea marina TaxID=361055 RepID=UPI0003803C47|nr:hypothetical protein [Rubritalea marina]